MGTTLGKKEEVKKSVRTKKVAPVKRVPKKETAKKSVTPKAKSAAKTVTKKQVSRVKKTPKPTPESSSPSEVVFVPGAASLRLLEKVQLYSLWYERHVPATMSAVAKVGGYAFIILGTVFAVYSFIDVKNIIPTPAALVCTEEVCTDIPDTELAATAPKISFINSIPTALSSDTDFKIVALNTDTPIITLTAVETGNTVVLEPAERINETEYRFMLPAGRLTPASYTIEASAEKEGSTYTFVGPTFIIVSKEPLVAPVVEEVKEPVVLGAATTSEPVAAEAVEEMVATSTEEVEETTDESTDEEVIVDEEETVNESVTQGGALSTIAIALHTDTQAEYLKITTGEFAPNRVEVYSQTPGSTQPLYLGQATLVHGEWVFSVSALQLPYTNHNLYASFVVAGKTYQSEAVLYVPQVSQTTSPDTEADLAVLVQKIELALLASNVNNENRRSYLNYFASLPEVLFVEEDERQFAETPLLEVINTAMLADAAALEPLLLQYAAAVQAENDFFIALASSALTDHYTKLASTIAGTIAEPGAVPAIHTVLALRYQVLKDKVRESEEQIKQDTNNLTSKDGDQDGISDFDEVANFGTNPLYADTDKDGVLDSVELVRNSDPLVANQTIVPILNKNIEEVTFDAVVEINFVGPQILTTQEDETGEHFVRIEGRSVPNSYVYLLSYTTGVVGVIKTSSTGTFSYTIERDFGIGEHEIAAVLTDVSGGIVASSKPHRFARTENAFVAAAAMSRVEGQGSQPTENNVLLHLLVAAVGVITFGFILLLLSNTLRTRRPQKTLAV